MTTYISILRGINVSGQKKVLMADLKELYASLGFTEVTTYIQSGNVIFKTSGDLSAGDLCNKIEKAIEGRYKFQVPVIIRNAGEINAILSSNPFLAEKGIDPERLHVTFLGKDPQPSELSAILKFDYPPDRFAIIGKEVYLYCPGGYGNTKLSNSFFENKLKVTATTRNWKTVGKLAELASF
ncbi:MAG: DUF1697 domain-containing protein [Bacteroidetes bacterium]|nr:DUF1697 domain-containing protein [Bacteroidota bacterium]